MNPPEESQPEKPTAGRSEAESREPSPEPASPSATSPTPEPSGEPLAAEPVSEGDVPPGASSREAEDAGEAVPPERDGAERDGAPGRREAGSEQQADAGSPTRQAAAQERQPTFLFFGVVAAVSLVADVTSKAWAEVTMHARGFVPIEIIEGHLGIILAYNRGGAWGLLQDASETIRKPFFLIVSAAAILFIVSLYGKLHPAQKALKWGLPLVLGGALGNLSDRITRSQVIDFIDYRGEWVLGMNTFIRRYVDGWTLTDHWPTFNVADIAICIGVGLMAVDMFTSRRLRQTIAEQQSLDEARLAASSPEDSEGAAAESRPA